MKKFTIALAVLAVFAMVGSAYAEVIFSGNTAGTPIGTTGLVSYTISIVGTTSFEDIRITDEAGSEAPGSVHQMSMNMGTYALDTIYTPFSPLPGTNAQGYDTRFAFALSDLAMGNPAPDDPTVDGVETSNFVDTYGIGTQDMFYAPGMGTFDTDGMSFSFFQNSPFINMKTQVTPFMHIVLPEDAYVYLKAKFTDGAVFNTCDLRVGVPEPSTIVMLVVGGLCLLVARFRK